MKISHSHRMLLECLLLFGIMPGVLSLMKPHGWMYVMLWIVAWLAWVWLKRHYAYAARLDWNSAGLHKHAIKAILLRFLPLAIALFAFTWIMIPERLFSLPRNNPQLWIMVMIFYPLLSVIPQEIVFRSFFLRRYVNVFKGQALPIASAVAFGWVHILLQNWVAVTFAGVGGYLFATTYLKTRSLAAVCFEHALYGCYLFTIGLGFYFYHGQAVH